MTFARSWLAAVALCVLAACGSMLGKDSGPALVDTKNVKRIVAIEWELKTMTVEGTRIIMHPDTRMTILFGPDGSVAGFAAVNQYQGQYKVTDAGQLSWPVPLITTRKAGPPELMDKERAYLKGLPKTSRAIVTNQALQLQSEDGNTVLAFIKAGT